jgi:hypothetical protein
MPKLLRVVTGTVIAALVLFAIGWGAYPLLLSFVSGNAPNRLVADSIETVVMARWQTSLSFALSGAAVFLAQAIGRRAKSQRRWLPITMALLGAVVWTFMLEQRMQEVTALVSDQVMLPMAAAPVYQIGLIAAVCALAGRLMSTIGDRFIHRRNQLQD